MDEQKMREIAQQVYLESQTRGQFSPVKIPVHIHNGIDNQKISARNLVYNNKIITSIFAQEQPVSLVTLDVGVFNPTSIKAFGITRNNLAGAAVKKSSFSGAAELGTCFSVTSATNINNIPQNVAQMCSGSFFDNTTGAWVPTAYVVGINNASFPTGLLGSSNIAGTFAYVRVVSFSNTSITFEQFADSDWSITCNLIIT